MTRDQIRTRIAELDKLINSEIAGTRLPPAMRRRQFPTTMWALAGACFGWALLGGDIPGAQDLHQAYESYGMYAAVFLGAIALWGTFLFLIQPSNKVSPEYKESTERVRAFQEERRDLVAHLRSLEE